MIGVGKNELWVKLCENVLHQPQYAVDPRFDSISNRVAHKHDICEILENWSTQYSVNEVVDMLLAEGIPAGPLLTIKELAEDPHFNDHRQMFPYMEQPGVGPFRVTAMPIKFSDTPTAISRPAPSLGEHNEEIYTEMLGLTPDEILNLRNKGII